MPEISFGIPRISKHVSIQIIGFSSLFHSSYLWFLMLMIYFSKTKLPTKSPALITKFVCLSFLLVFESTSDEIAVSASSASKTTSDSADLRSKLRNLKGIDYRMTLLYKSLQKSGECVCWQSIFTLIISCCYRRFRLKR